MTIGTLLLPQHNDLANVVFPWKKTQQRLHFVVCLSNSPKEDVSIQTTKDLQLEHVG